MASLNDYIASLGKNKPNYGNLFSGLSAPSSNVFGSLGANSTANSTPITTAPKQPTPLVSSAPASTATTPAVVKPPVVSTPTAKSQFISSVTTPPAVTPTPPAYSQPGYKSPGQIQDEADAAKAKANTSSDTSSLADYLALYSGQDIQKARGNLADIQNKVDERSLATRREAEAKLDQPGLTKGGAVDATNTINRRSASELADLGVAESGASRTLSALTEGMKPLQIGDTYIDPNTGKIIYQKPVDTGFSLSEGQARYEKDPVTGQYKQIALVPKTTAGGSTSGGGGTYVAGANPTVDSWANRIQNGTAKITDIPASQASLRNQVTVALDAMGNSAEGKPTTTELGKAALVTAKSLLDKFDAGSGTSVVGGSRVFGGALAGITPGTDASNFRNDFNALKSQLSLEGVKYLKGQGQVSDAERALLAQAVTKLNLSQSDAEFRSTLEKIVNRLSTGSENTPPPAPVILTKNGQSFDASALSPEEIQQALLDGYTQQ